MAVVVASKTSLSSSFRFAALVVLLVVGGGGQQVRSSLTVEELAVSTTTDNNDDKKTGDDGGSSGGGSSGGSSSSSSFSPPRVIFNVLADDLGIMDVDCGKKMREGVYSSKYYETPHLCALAQQGVWLSGAFSPSPVCSPSRASILTGRYPLAMGWTDAVDKDGKSGRDRPNPATIDGTRNLKAPMFRPEMSSRLNEHDKTYAEELRETGNWTTLFLGKWHLGTKYDEFDSHPSKRGYNDVWGGTHNSGPGGSYFSRAPGVGWKRLSPAVPTTDVFGREWPEGTHVGDAMAEYIVWYIANWLEKNETEHLLIDAWLYDVHGPWMAKTEDRDRFKNKTSQNKRFASPTYAGMIYAFDYNLGKVLEGLDLLGLTEDTFVTVTSDNGASLGWIKEDNARTSDCFPLKGGKQSPSDGGMAVPFIARWLNGGVKGGVMRDRSLLASGVDLFATMMDAAGIEPTDDNGGNGTTLMKDLPEYAHIPRDGNSLMPLLRHGKPVRDVLIGAVRASSSQNRGAIMVRTAEHKLVVHLWRLWRGDGVDPKQPTPDPEVHHAKELFRVKDDPYEVLNLIDLVGLDDGLTIAYSYLANVLDEFLKREEYAMLPIANPNYLGPRAISGSLPTDFLPFGAELFQKLAVEMNIKVTNPKEGYVQLDNNLAWGPVIAADFSHKWKLPRYRNVSIHIASANFGKGTIAWAWSPESGGDSDEAEKSNSLGIGNNTTSLGLEAIVDFGNDRALRWSQSSFTVTHDNKFHVYNVPINPEGNQIKYILIQTGESWGIQILQQPYIKLSW